MEVTPPYLSVNQGNSFRLFCLVTPSLPATWSKVNGSFPGGSDKEKGTLVVYEASVNHTGKYRCHARNDAGSSEAVASVTVFGKKSKVVLNQIVMLLHLFPYVQVFLYEKAISFDHLVPLTLFLLETLKKRKC